MTIYAVEDELIALNGLVDKIRKVRPEAEVRGFRFAREALECAETFLCDVAFVDIKMRDMDGVAFAQKLISLNPKVNIIFTTGYSEYMKEAFEMHASGYIMKPVTEEEIERELSNLRYEVQNAKLTVRAFGDFEVFYKGKPVQFHMAKTKELFAYLVDRRGAVMSNRAISAVLWEDDFGGFGHRISHESYFKKIRRDLRNTLDSIGCGDVLIQEYGSLGIYPNAIDCDYYHFLESDSSLYRGEYMSQYSWSEMTHAMLESRVER